MTPRALRKGVVRMAAKRIEMWLGARFWDDHTSRETEDDLLLGLGISLDERSKVLKRSGSRVLVSMNQLCIAELTSDADYYATGFGYGDDAEIRGLISSAKATVRGLAKLGFVHPVDRGDIDEYDKA